MLSRCHGNKSREHTRVFFLPLGRGLCNNDAADDDGDKADDESV